MTITWRVRPLMPRNVLVDTSAILAIVSETDRFHDSAIEIYRDLLDSGDTLLTNSYVLVESSALIHRRLGFEPLREFIRSIQGVWEILWIDRITHEEIWKRMENRGGTQLSFVDWSVIVSAENIRSSIFTFDSDFALEGLTVIPARVQ